MLAGFPGAGLARVASGPLTDQTCAASASGWLLNRGASWWDRNYQNTLYKHYITKNSVRPDCIVYHNLGWTAARSAHPGGVNLLFCDGHVTFVRDSVDLSLWGALSTRAGGEVVGAGAF